MNRTRSRWLRHLLFIACIFFITSCQVAPDISTHVQHIENGLLPAVSLHGQPAPIGMRLAQRMIHYHVPGVGIAVINDGKLEWARGYGVQEAGSAKPVTTETLFQAASISKPVVATAALSLVQSGKLNLDENINLELTSWKVPDNDFTKDEKVTLRRLLSHSAGLNVEDVASYASREELPTLVQALDGIKPAHSDPVRVQSVPGSSFRYSGGGYSVIQQLLMDVTGKPFHEAMRELVTSKIGMTSSTFRQPLPADFEPTAATGHQVNGEPFKGRWYTFPQAAAAGLWTTPSDLARFAIEIQRSYKSQSNAVLSMDTAKQMLTPQLGGYGLGFWLGGKGKAATFSHPGKNEGFTCMLFAYLETGQGAVVMTNGDGGNGLFNEILRAIAHEYGWPDYRPREKTTVPGNSAAYGSYAGDYDVSGIRVSVSRDGDQLFVLAPPVWPQPARLYPSGDDRFFLVDEDVDLIFVRDAKGNTVEMRAVTSGQTVTARRIPLR
jgi:CubicO group peptidase (beta-lactamase class C family)